MRETQEQLLQSEKLASIGQLAAGVAHEINNPIGVMLGFAQVLLKRVKEDDPTYKPLTTIEREGLRCKRIVQSLLDFARHSKPEPRRVNVNDVIDASLELSHQSTRSNIHLIKEYSPNLPPVLADINQLQQVFLNILLNAYDAMSNGGTLRIVTGLVMDRVDIAFSDTGVGIPPENLTRIFDPFFTTKEVGKGTGLGLSISYGIVEQHGGTIEVKSQVGEGSTFTVHLPVAPQGRN